MNFRDFGQGLGIGKEQNMFVWDNYIQRINSVQTDYKTTPSPASSMSNNQEQNELSTISNRSNGFFKSDTNNMQRLQNDQISQGMLDVNNFEGSRLSKKQESSQRNFDDDEDIFKSIKSDIYQNQSKVLPINKLMNLNPEDHNSTQTNNKRKNQKGGASTLSNTGIKQETSQVHPLFSDSQQQNQNFFKAPKITKPQQNQANFKRDSQQKYKQESFNLPQLNQTFGKLSNDDSSAYLIGKASQIMKTAENLRSKATKVLPKIEEIVKDVSEKVQKILKTLEQKNQRTKKQEMQDESNQFIQEKCYQIEQLDNQLQQYTNLINPIVETKISKSKYESQLNIEISQLEMFKFDSHKYEKVYKYIDDYTLAIKRLDEELIDIVQVVNENNSFHLQKVYQMEIPQYFVIHGDRVVTDQKCFDLKTNQIIFNFETGSIDAFSLTDEFLIIAYTLYAKIVVYKWQNDTYEPYSKGSILNYGGQMKNEFFFRFRKNPYLEDDMIFYAQYRKSIYMITLNIEKISQSKAQKLNSQHEIADYNFINAFLMACISDTEITLIDYIQAKTLGVIKFQPNLCCIVPNQFNMSNMPIYIANNQSAYNELIVQDILSQGFKGKARLEGNKVPLSKIRVVNFENSEVTHVLILDEDRRLKLIEFIIE